MVEHTPLKSEFAVLNLGRCSLFPRLRLSIASTRMILLETLFGAKQTYITRDRCKIDTAVQNVSGSLVLWVVSE